MLSYFLLLLLPVELAGPTPHLMLLECPAVLGRVLLHTHPGFNFCGSTFGILFELR